MAIKEEEIIKLFSSSKISSGIVGIGDDCAVIPKDNNSSWLISTDNLVEGTHFLFNAILPKDLGYKTIAVNISDIAAMGGFPKFIFLSAAIPQDKLTKRWLKDFAKSVKNICDNYGVEILGGETTASHSNLCLSVTVIGERETKNIKFRKNAQHDDVICITGHTGLSKAGLECILNKEYNHDLVKYHINPYIYVKEAAFLSSFEQVHSMMDLSDGLDQDLRKICQASNCSAEINIDDVPISQKLKSFADSRNFNSEQTVLSGGEDYVILFTASSLYVEELLALYQKKFNKSFFSIGRIIAKNNQLVSYIKSNKRYQPILNNFNHFEK